MTFGAVLWEVKAAGAGPLRYGTMFSTRRWPAVPFIGVTGGGGAR